MLAFSPPCSLCVSLLSVCSSALPASSSTAAVAGPAAPPRGFYIAHAQHPTTITHSVTCSFTSPTDTNLVLARVSRLDIMRVTDTGLSLMLELPIDGRIAAMTCFLPSAAAAASSSLASSSSSSSSSAKALQPQQHRLVLVTEQQQLIVLQYDSASRHVVSSFAALDLSHKVGQLSDYGSRLLVSPRSDLIVCHQYEGVISCLPVDSRGGLGESVDVRIDECRVLDLCFLHGHSGSRHAIAVLYSDHKEKRHVRTFALDVKEREAKPAALSVQSLDYCPAYLIPVEEVGGLLVVGEESVVLYGADGKRLSHVLLTPCTVTSWGRIDSRRYLLSNLHGDLFMVVIQSASASGSVASAQSGARAALHLHLQLLGQTTIATCIAYLSSGFTFLGSTLGDHQLVQLHTQQQDDGGFLSLVDSFPNLGSVVDMAVMEMDRQGQGQLVTCSGAFHCGSLRIVRNGVGVEEEASIELAGIQGMWGLKGAGEEAEQEQFLIQSFVGETRVLSMEEEELGEIEMPGLEAALPSIHCGDMQGGQLLQVTERSVRLIDAASLQLQHEWKEGRITVATSSRQHCLVCMGRTLVLLRCTGSELQEQARATLDNEVACIDSTPLEAGQEARWAVVGMWNDLSLRVLALPSLAEVSREVVGGEVIPRSALLCPFAPSSVYLLAGIGDGRLLSFALSPTTGALSQRKSLTLGSQPLSLSPFRSNGALHVVAACDRPTVVYCLQGRLLYSNVNLKQVTHVASFSTATFPSSLAFASASHLTIGPIDSIQKLHVQSVPLGAQPRRVAWHREEGLLLVIVSRHVRDESRRGSVGVQWREISELLAVDDSSLQIVSRVELERDEVGSAVFVAREPLQSELLVVLGTTVVVDSELLPSAGRLLLLRAEGKKLSVVSSTKTKGGVNCIAQVLGRVVCGINSKVVVYRTVLGSEGAAPRLLAECSHVGGTLTLQLAVQGPYVVVGDMQHSVSFLLYAPAAVTGSAPTLELVARDWDSVWMTALSSLWTPPASTSAPASASAPSSAPPASPAALPLFIGADDKYNLFYFQRNAGAAEEDRTRVDVRGRFHLGDFVNVIAAGSLTSTAASGSSSSPAASHLFATISGAIGVLAPLQREEFVFFSRLEEAMEKAVGSVGRLSHRDWRAWKQDRGRREQSSLGFVDGDLVELALELQGEQQAAVSRDMECSWQEITRRVEEMARLH